MELLNEIQQKIKAPKTQTNAHGKYKYRSCSDILSAVKPLLGTAFIQMVDDMVEIGGRNYVKATVKLFHEGKSVESTGFAREAAEQKGMNAGQLSCATSSYARKLALSGLFGIDDSHDAGNGKNGDKPASPKEVLAQAFAKYVQEADIPEHFSLPLDVFTKLVKAEGLKRLKTVEERKAFAYTIENLQPWIDAAITPSLHKLLEEDK